MGSKPDFVASLFLGSTELTPSCGSFGADHAGRALFPRAASQDRGKGERWDENGTWSATLLLLDSQHLFLRSRPYVGNLEL